MRLEYGFSPFHPISRIHSSHCEYDELVSTNGLDLPPIFYVVNYQTDELSFDVAWSRIVRTGTSSLNGMSSFPVFGSLLSVSAACP